jgi:hypothetical protein
MNTPVSSGGTAVAATTGAALTAAASGGATAPAATLASSSKLSGQASPSDTSAGETAPTLAVKSSIIEGTVFAADRSTPVPDSLVELLTPTGSARVAATLTGADGTYRFVDVVSGADGALVRAHSPTAFATIAEQRVSSRSAVVDLTLPLSVVRGTVRFSSGAPVRFPTAFLETVGGLFVGFAAVNDDLGRFVIFGAPPGPFRLVVQDSDSALTRTIGSQLAGVDIPTALDVELPPSTTLTGRVVGPDGNAVAFAGVALESSGLGFVRFARADSNGVYEFRDVAVGAVSVQATSLFDSRQLFGGATGQIAQSGDPFRLDVVLTDMSEPR